MSADAKQIAGVAEEVAESAIHSIDNAIECAELTLETLKVMRSSVSDANDLLQEVIAVKNEAPSGVLGAYMSQLRPRRDTVREQCSVIPNLADEAFEEVDALYGALVRADDAR